MSSNLDSLLENTGDMALKRRAKTILSRLNPQKGDKILDIGCGDGYYLHLLSKLNVPNVKLIGTDFDPKGLEKAKKNLDPKIKLFSGDLMKKLPFESAAFDKVVMSEVAEHLPNDIKGLKEVRRILKAGGTICLTVPHANYPFLWDPANWLLEWLVGLHIKSGFFAGIWNQHIRLYTTESAKKMMEDAGFIVEEVKSLTFWSLPFNHYIVNIVARYLHNQYTVGKPNKSLNKFTTAPKRHWLLNLAFKAVNVIDKLNDVWQPASSGVAVFVKAKKP